MSAANSQPVHNTGHSFIIATAGHVDHGKTSLVRALTGTDTDTLREEKERGLTINLGFAYSEEQLPDEESSCTLGFVDVPGHRDFIHNMLAGVGSVNAALLVIAADDGIMPQTREHLTILDLLGVELAVVAISKCDSCDAEKLDQLTASIQKLLAGTSMASAEIIPTSSKSGVGLTSLKRELLKLAQIKRLRNSGQRHFRFQVDRSFSVKGIGTVVTGTTLAGQARREQSVALGRSNEQFRMRGLRLHESEIDQICHGERAAINLAGANHKELQRGDWLHDPWLHHPVTRFDAFMHWHGKQAPASGAQYHLHIGAAHQLVSLRQLGAGDEPWFQIKCPQPLCIHYGDRFIIRDPAGTETLGGGHVVDIFVPRKHRASAERLAALTALDQCDEDALIALLKNSDCGVDQQQFRLSRNLTEVGMEKALEKARDAGTEILTIRSDSNHNISFSRTRFEDLGKRLLHAVRKFHDNNPSLTGIAEPQISRELSFAGSFALLQAVVGKLLELGMLQRTGSLYHLPAHSAKVSVEEQVFITTIRPLLEAAGRIPPRTRELAESTGLPLARIEAVLKSATRSGLAIKVADNRYFLPETILELAGFTETLIATNSDDGGFSVIDFRDGSGIGRNLCIEILEFFDHCGFTRRDGNTRYLRTEKENVFS